MTQRLLSAGLVFAGMYAIVRGAPQSPPASATFPGRDSRRRRQILRSAEADLAVLRRRRAELRLHEGRQEAARRAGRSWRASRSTSARTTCSPPATARRRSSGARPTPTREDAKGNPIYDWTILDRHLRHLSGARRAAVRADRLHAEGAVDQAGAVSAPLDADGEVRRDLHRLGLSAEGLREMGASWSTSGRSIASTSTAEPKSRAGTGKSGTRRTSATGAARRRSSASCTTTRSTRVRRACRPPASAGPTRRAAAASSRATSSSTASAARTTPPEDGHAARLHRVPRQRRRRRIVDGHVRMGIANQLRTIDDGFRIVASFPELKTKPIVIGESDPEGCAACQGPQLAYRNWHDVFQLHGGQLRPQARSGRTARRQSRRRADLGVRVRGPAYFAGFRALATNGIDKPVLNVFRMFSKMSGERSPQKATAPSLDTMVKQGVRERPTSRRWRAAIHAARPSSSGTTTMTTFPARPRRCGWLSRDSRSTKEERSCSISGSTAITATPTPRGGAWVHRSPRPQRNTPNSKRRASSPP